MVSAEEEMRRFKLLGTGSALVAMLALIAALYLQMQNASLSASVVRLEADKAQLAAKNAELQTQLNEARASARACPAVSQLTALLPLLVQSGMLGNIAGLPGGIPGMPGGVFPGGNLTGGQIPLEQIIEILRNASGNQTTAR